VSQAESKITSTTEKSDISASKEKSERFEKRCNLWARIQSELKRKLGVERFGIWFQKTELMHFADSTLVVGVPNVIIKQYLEQKYKSPVCEIARDLTGEDYEVRFDVAPKLLQRRREEIESLEISTGKQEAENKKHNHAPAVPESNALASGKGAWQTGHCFEHLITTESNRLPFLAAQEIGCKEIPRFDFLIVLGKPGLGKTALLESIAHGAKNCDIAKKPVCTMAETWCNDYYYSLQKRNTYKFRKYYRSCDMFLLDGIQFLQGKPAAQDELLFTVKTLRANGARVVLSCSQHPNDLQEIKPETDSFLKEAFWAELKMPPKQERVQIVEKLAGIHTARISPEVCIYLAETFTGSMRELNASVSTTATYADLNGCSKIDLQTAREALSASGRCTPKVITIDEICGTVAEICGITVENLKGKSRSRTICRARHMVTLLASELTELSLSDIGRELGGRSHSTINHSISEAVRLGRDNTSFAGTLTKARTRLA